MLRGVLVRCSVLCGLFAALGCGGTNEMKTVAVAGKITKGGAPWSLTQELGGAKLPPGDAGGSVIFISKGGAKEQSGVEYNAALNAANGTFTVPGPYGKGLPPGEYEVVVYIGAFGGASKGPPGGGGGLPGKSGGSMHGKEIGRKSVTVPEAGISDIALDLAK